MSVPKQIQTSSTLPRRRGKASKTLRLEQAILEIVEERHPVTVRGVCYGLFTRGMLPDMSKNSTGKISRIMTEMRETEALLWKRIVDGSRSVQSVNQWKDPAAIIGAATKRYRRNNWQDQPVLVEVWSEKSTVGGVLGPVLDELGITFRVMKGFGSFTALRQAAEDSIYLPCDRNGIVLYIGDWDPSGLYMSEVDLPRRLDRYGSRWSFNRIALIRDDLDGLPHFDAETKKDDARCPWFVSRHGRKCWELDAMSPNLLRERVRDEIKKHMDMDAWQRALDVEAVEKQSMHEFHAEWQRRISGQAAR